MSRLIYEWLNNEYHDGRMRGLSQRVENAGPDMSSGYLLGELLSKYNQQSDFHLFSEKPEGKTMNLCLLEPTMRAVGVTFSSKVSAEVAAGNEAITKQLLYELKTSLDRIVKLSNQSMNGKGNNGVILKVIGNTRPSYDRTKSLGFENSIKAYLKSADDSLMEKVIEKYQHTKLNFRNSVNSSHAEVVGALQSQRDRLKDMEVHKKEHEKLFNKAWEHMNTERWKQNMKVTHDRVDAKRRFVEKTVNRTNMLKTQYKSAIIAETYSGMEDFDRRMQTEVFAEDPDIKETVGKAMQMSIKGMPGTGAPDLGYIDERLLKQGFVRAQLTLKEHHDEALACAQLHDRRRRRFIRERETIQTSELERSSDREILEQMLLPCNAELWEDFANQKVQTRKKIVLENAAHRKSINEAIDKSLAGMTENWRAEEARREVHWIVSSQIDSQMERIETARVSASSAIRQESISYVSDTLSKIFDLVEWCVTCRALGAYEGNKLVSLEDTTELLPAYVWNDGVQVFLSDLDMAKELPHVRNAEVSDISPFSFAKKVNVFDEPFIFTKPLQTHDVVCLPNAPAEEAPVSAPIVAIKEGQAVSEARSISQMLANIESSKFFLDVFAFAGTADAASTVVPASNSNSGDANALTAPVWTTTSAPRYFLGEALVTSSCVSLPIPNQITPLHDLPKFDVKLSVVCNSEVLSKVCVNGICTLYPDIYVLSVGELVNSAVFGSEEVRNERVISAIERGSLISDDLYVELIVNELIRIGKSERYSNSAQKSFVLTDFPRSRPQAILLFKALSGIDYSEHYPQALDRQSNFAACVPRVEEKFDVKASGIDCCICISGESNTQDVPAIVTEVVGARDDLKNGSIVYLNPALSDLPADVKTLHEPYSYDMPVHASGLKAHFGSKTFSELKEFLDYMTVSETLTVSGGTAEEINSYVRTASINAINSRLGNKSNVVDSSNIAASPIDGDGGNVAAPSSDTSSVKPALPIDTEVRLNRKLADILVKMWQVHEVQSKHSSNELFNSLRDVRYQTLQRRRTVFDNLSEIFLLSDDRQSTYFNFVNSFNLVDSDFRFDPDCKNELHLRTLELGDQLWQLCDKRKARIEDFIQSVAFDGAMSLNIYRCQVEGANKMQNELSRFYAALHVIFDLTKGICSYNRKRETVQAENSLEEALAIAIPTVELLVANAAAAAAAAGGKGGKDAKGGKPADKGGKKGEVPTAVPFRDPLAPVVLPITALRTLPEIPVAPSKEPEAAGGKGGKAPPAKAAAGKKGEAEPPKDVDVVDLMEKAVLDVLTNWQKDKFTVQRLLYNNDESYCSIVEQAVWFECDRLKSSLASIRAIVTDQTAWIKAQEADLISLCQSRLKDRYDVEVNAVQRLTTMIGDIIENHESIRELWLLSPDIISIHCNKLFVKDYDPYVVPTRVLEFYHDVVNEEQKNVLLKWIQIVRLGDLVLVEDLRSLLNHCQIFRGTLGSVSEVRKKETGESTTFSSQIFDLLMPPTLRQSVDGVPADGKLIFEDLCRDQPVIGSDERKGTVAIKDVLAAFKIAL